MGINQVRIAPIRALVGELVRFVEVEGIDDVAVGKRVLGEQVDDVRPVRAGGDDGVFRGRFANGLAWPPPGCPPSGRDRSPRARS